MTKASTAVVVATPRDKVAVIDQALEERRDALLAILPGTMDYERFRKVVTLAVSKSPELMECEAGSIVRAVIEAAELGLEPTGILGRAYLVGYNENVAPKGAPPKYVKRAQLQIGYLGLAELARRSGVIRAVEARLVYEGDTFRVRMGTDRAIEHEPAFLTSDPEKITMAYAIVWFHDGTWDFEPMPKGEIDGIRSRSKSANRGPWMTDYGEMAKKTVLRRLLKRQPLTIETLDAIGRDDEREYAAPVVVDSSAARERIMSKLRPAVPALVEPTGEEGEDGDHASGASGAPDRPVAEPSPAPASEPEASPVAAPPAEEVVGEVVSEESAPEPKRSARERTLCGAPSPYDETTCQLVEKHLGLHRSNGGKASWGD